MATIFGKYSFGKKIGEGKFGKVFCAKKGFDEYAVKVIKKSQNEDPKKEYDFLNEMSGKVAPNVVEFVEDQNQYFIVMELCNGVSLDKKISKYGLKNYSQSVALIQNIAKGIQSIHKRGIIHNDIKPENIIVIGGNIRVVDFGLAEHISEEDRHYNGTPYYSDPEKKFPNHYNELVDVYAFGVLIFEILVGMMGGLEWYEKFQQNKTPLAYIPPKWKNIVLECISTQNNRPSIETVIEKIG